MLMYDYSKLYGKITEVCGTQARFAKKMGISEHSMSRKLNQQIDFRQSEIKKAADILGIAEVDYYAYFFTSNVQCS